MYVDVVLNVMWILLLMMCGSSLLIFLLVVFRLNLCVCVRLLDVGVMLIIYMGLSIGEWCSLYNRLVLMLFGLINVYLIFFIRSVFLDKVDVVVVDVGDVY